MKKEMDLVRNPPDLPEMEMTRPISEWDKKDREGTMGQMLFFPPGSKKYQDRYELIDWAK